MTKPYEITMAAGPDGFTLRQLCTFVTRAIRDDKLSMDSQVHANVKFKATGMPPLKDLAIVAALETTEERKEQDGD